MFGIVVASFQVQNQHEKPQFFQETFLVTDIDVDVVLRIPFLAFSNANIQFNKSQLTFESYTVSEVLAITKWV